MVYDLAIIGAGPAGLSAAIYARRAGLSVICFEASVIGGQIANTPELENYPAAMKISGMDFAENLKKQAEDFGTEIVRKRVIETQLDGEIKQLICKRGSFEAKTVIFATGTEQRKMNVPGEEEFSGRGVSYCATCDGAFFRDKVATVVGSGNTAVIYALYLSSICSKVNVILSYESFKGEKVNIEKLLNDPKIECYYETKVLAVEGDMKVTDLKLLDVKTEKEFRLDTDAVFVAIGQVPQTGLLKDKVKLNKKGYVDTDENCRTEIPGVFVAGDLRNKELRQVVTAVSDGAVAATEAIKYLM